MAHPMQHYGDRKPTGNTTMNERDELPTKEYASEIWQRILDPDAFPGESEDRIVKDYEWAAELVFRAYVEGRLMGKNDVRR